MAKEKEKEEKDKDKQKIEGLDDIFKEDFKVDNSKKNSKNDSETKGLNEIIEKLTKEKEDLNNKYLLSLAEQKNYKKRLDDEMDRFYKYASFDVCKEIIPILDSFDLALEKKYDSGEIKAYLEGFKLTRGQIFKVLEKQGVKEIESLGKEFDPNEMVAIAIMEDKTKKDQEVLKVFMKGYMFKDRVLRPANVIVNHVSNEEVKEETESKETESKETVENKNE